MNKKRIILASSLALGAVGSAATAAQAHVTLQPKTAAAGAYVVEAVRVPNETDDATTTKVAVQFPDGFGDVSYQAVDGWSVKVVKGKLAKPIETDDGQVTEGVKTVTWTADKKSDGIAPGQFRDFPISIQVPGKAGDTLTFKALQTYSDGEVVRWIGDSSSDKPAPTISVTEAMEDHHAASGSSGGTATTEQTGLGSPLTKDTFIADDSDSNTLAIVALIVGALGLLTGGAALASARRRP
ncbi:YcnI family protein [Baekduia sp. Peel2402]|uniref:YcnI family protein n=1 Tax=Baekduia sp. Peel2402 TaxID=3458296 RepID=UPI00403E8AEB